MATGRCEFLSTGFLRKFWLTSALEFGSIMAVADKVLIIDDEPDSCLLWRSFLTQLKYNVFTALTLRQGLELVESVKPDIIFLDNNLPDGLGWDQLDTIQNKIPHCRINLVSAYDFDPEKYKRPNVNVLRKPVTLSRIRSLLK